MDAIYSWSAGRRYALSAGSIALATLMLTWLSADLQVTNIALLYLLVVLLVATMIGMGPGILASVLAFLGFNFFFVEPLHSFRVTDPQDDLRLLTFLVVAIIGSSLAGRAREQANAAARSARELAALYGFSEEISAEVDLERILPLVAQTVTQLLNVPVCSVLLYDSAGRLIERATAGATLPEPQRRVDAFLRIGRRVLGVLRVTQRALDDPLTSEEQSRLETIASQVGLVLERARLVEEASQGRAQAEAERMKATLLSSVSHDLRTPLAAITGAASSLLEAGDQLGDATRTELLSSIHQEAERLDRLVNNLLEMTRLEAGGVTIRKEWQPLEGVLGAVLKRLDGRLRDREVHIDLPGDLPLVPFDAMLVEQVLINILENAVKYTPVGSAIDVSAATVGGAVRIDIADRGPGLATGEEERVFDKFYRSPGAKGRGVGLGLAISRAIIDAHGGRIWAEPRPGGGAVFHFTLPLGDAAPEAPPADG
jgi:two-component system sensor histidine kinase KdpD